MQAGARGLRAEDSVVAQLAKPHAAFACSFCGKTERDGVRIVEGPTVHICNECVQMCIDILADPDLVPKATVTMEPVDT